MRVQEKKWETIPTASDIPSEKKNKTGTSGCGSFVVAYSQPATSMDHLISVAFFTMVFNKIIKQKERKNVKKTYFHSFVETRAQNTGHVCFSSTGLQQAERQDHALHPNSSGCVTAAQRNHRIHQVRWFCFVCIHVFFPFFPLYTAFLCVMRF